MKTISYSAAFKHLAEPFQQVCTEHEPVVITREDAEPVVIVSLADFKAMNETNYLLKSPANAARLAETIDEIEAMIAQDTSKNDKSK